MPAFSPNSKRIVYWGLNAALRSESNRTYVWWDLYERTADGSRDERRVTDQGYPGIYTGPRYLPDGESILYTAWNDRASGYTFVVDRFDGIRRSPVQRQPIPPWRTVNAQYLHAFHASRGWLLGRSALSFLPPGPGASLVEVYDATPYEASVVDVSPSGRWVVSLQGASKGTMESGGFAGYWNAAAPVINRPAVPVMAIVDVESSTVTPATNWPADVEPVNSRPDD
jgi:hypothetical protein